jgi:hypothetical protein
MTLRAFIIGLISALFLAAYAFYNDVVILQNLIVGTHFPQSIYGSLLVSVILVNPTLWLIHRYTRWKAFRPFSGKELCLIMALVLPTCGMSTCTFLKIVPRAMMLPHHYAKTTSSWKLLQPDGKTYKPVTSLLPEFMLADPEMDDALTTMIQGARTSPDKPISFSQIPWRAWKKPLAYWIPLFVIMWTALAGLSLVFHRQWASNEHLPYPIVQVARSILPDANGKPNPILREKIFWIGLSIIFAIHLNNYLRLYFPDVLIPITRTYDFRAFRDTFPTFVKGGGYGTLMWIRCYYTVIGLAFMLPTDICFSIGLSPFVFFTIFGIFINLGYPLRIGTLFSPRPDWGMVFGAYCGFFAVLLYTGRHYYWETAKRAIGLRGDVKIEESSVWGMRVFVVGIIAFIIGITRGGLDWQLSIILAIMMVIAYLVMARILAETGMYHLNPNLYPGVLLMALFGEQALGPTTLAIILFTTTMFFMDTRETFLPFMSSALKFLDGTGPERKPETKRYFPMLAVVMALSLVAAISSTWYFSYDRGINWRDGFGTRNTPTNTFNGVVTARTQLEAQGLLEQSEQAKGFGRLAMAKPSKPFIIAFITVFAGFIFFSTMRLRHHWWPIHPIIFCAWSGYAGYVLAWSFVIGGIIKVITMKFGGSKFYHRLKPFFIGVIAGDLLSAIMVFLAGGIYYWITGTPPKSYWVLP